MADKNNKLPENVSGTFYVDKECINCDACILVAENHFRTNEDASFTYVYKQPETEEEIEVCQEALEACPVEAIGKDGASVEVKSGIEKEAKIKTEDGAKIEIEANNTHQNSLQHSQTSFSTGEIEQKPQDSLDLQTAHTEENIEDNSPLKKNQAKEESTYENQTLETTEKKTKLKGFFSRLF